MQKRGKAALALQRSRLADAEQFSQDAAQIVRGDRDQVTLGHLRDSLQPTASHAAGVAHVGKRPFAQFAVQPLIAFALDPRHTPAVEVDRAPLVRRLVGPTSTVFAARLRNIRPQTDGRYVV